MGIVRVVMLGMTGNAFTWQMFMACAGKCPLHQGAPGLMFQIGHEKNGGQKNGEKTNRFNTERGRSRSSTVAYSKTQISTFPAAVPQWA